jgi:hypothetical protein
VPHFSLQIESGGPILQALVSVSQPRAAALVAAGQSVPLAVPIRALVDTGASCTCVDPSVLAGLSLTPTGKVSLTTPSTGATPHDADQYDVGLILPAAVGAPPLILRTVPVVSSSLLVAQGFHALIGRDILDRCLFVYNGDARLFTLAF